MPEAPENTARKPDTEIQQWVERLRTAQADVSSIILQVRAAIDTVFTEKKLSRDDPDFKPKAMQSYDRNNDVVKIDSTVEEKARIIQIINDIQSGNLPEKVIVPAQVAIRDVIARHPLDVSAAAPAASVTPPAVSAEDAALATAQAEIDRKRAKYAKSWRGKGAEKLKSVKYDPKARAEALKNDPVRKLKADAKIEDRANKFSHNLVEMGKSWAHAVGDGMKWANKFFELPVIRSFVYGSDQYLLRTKPGKSGDKDSSHGHS